jgi:hypothetical protein
MFTRTARYTTTVQGPRHYAKAEDVRGTFALAMHEVPASSLMEEIRETAENSLWSKILMFLSFHICQWRRRINVINPFFGTPYITARDVHQSCTELLCIFSGD